MSSSSIIGLPGHRFGSLLILIIIGVSVQSANADNEYRPLTADYQREVIYRNRPKPSTLEGASFIQIYRKITKFSINPRLMEDYIGLRDIRDPAKVLTRSLTDYGAPSLSPDRRTLAYFDYTEDSRYRLNAYDLRTRNTTIVFEIAGGQTCYYVWMKDNTLFVQFFKLRQNHRSFAWLQRDEDKIYSATAPIAIALVDAAAVAYTNDGHQYFRYDRNSGESLWFRCAVQTEFIEYNPLKPVRVAKFDQSKLQPSKLPERKRSEYIEIKLPWEDVCVGKNGWKLLPKKLGCEVY